LPSHLGLDRHIGAIIEHDVFASIKNYRLRVGEVVSDIELIINHENEQTHARPFD
jgi:hypothetical protein